MVTHYFCRCHSSHNGLRYICRQNPDHIQSTQLNHFNVAWQLLLHFAQTPVLLRSAANTSPTVKRPLCRKALSPLLQILTKHSLRSLKAVNKAAHLFIIAAYLTPLRELSWQASRPTYSIPAQVNRLSM